MQTFLGWWERCVRCALYASIFLLGVGRVEMVFLDRNMSAWSVSRTTLGFWVILKLLRIIHRGWPKYNPTALLQVAPLAAFFAAVTLSLLPDIRPTGDYRYLVFAIAHAVMVMDMFATPDRQRWLLRLLALSPVIFIVRGFAHDPSVFNFSLAFRFGYPLDHANTAGYLLAMSFPLCLYLVLGARGIWRWLAALSCLGQILALLLTYSRGAWLGWSAAMIFFGVATKHWKYLLVTLAIATACVLALPSLGQRVYSVIRPSEDRSIGERLTVLQGAIRLGLENPFLGVGYGRGRLKQELRRSDRDTFRKDVPIWHAHNVYAELLAETGLLGLGTFFWLILSTLYRLLRGALGRSSAERLVGVTIAASWTAAAVSGLSDIPFYHHEPRIFFFSLFALASLYCRQGNVNSPVTPSG
jgi:O-antigen ligase